MSTPPQVTTPRLVAEGGRRIPRYIFRWPTNATPSSADLEAEVNANSLTIENLSLRRQMFWRTPWPITFGTTNVYEEPDPTEPTRPDLELEGVSREYALAFIRAILPEVSGFCAKLGPSIPSRVEESDIVMGG